MRLIDADAIPWTDLNSDMPNTKIKVLITFADKVNRMPTAGREWLHDLLQDAIDAGIITETQASRLMDMIDDSEDNT